MATEFWIWGLWALEESCAAAETKAMVAGSAIRVATPRDGARRIVDKAARRAFFLAAGQPLKTDSRLRELLARHEGRLKGKN